MLEFYTALIILAQFGWPDMDDEIRNCTTANQQNQGNISLTLDYYDNSSNSLYDNTTNNQDQSNLHSAHNLQRNSELIEHKLNLLILIFTFRDQHSLNISEVIIMARTCLNVMSKIYPQAEIFKNKQVQEEIKTLMISLFQNKIEEQIRVQKTINKQHQQDSKPKQAPQIVETMVNERGSTNVSLLKKYTASEKAPSSGFGSPFSKSSTTTSSSQSGLRKHENFNDQNPNQHETLEEKKDRLFKWTNYQNVKLSQEFVKDTLIENLNILRFINLFESFDKAIQVWGSNEQFQLGLILKKDLEKFYNRHSNSQEIMKKRQDQILQQIIDIKQRNYQQSNQQTNQNETPEQIKEIQSLLNEWQSLIMNQQQEQSVPQKQSSSKFTSFERKLLFEKPSLLLTMLNTSIDSIYSNAKFTLYLNSLGQVFSMGQDFRKVKHDFLYGIPRQLKIQTQIKQIALGKDHALFLDEMNLLYAFGSNQFGQLGITDKHQLDFQFHPLTYQKLYYALEPKQIPYFTLNQDDLQIKQICCGDYFSVVLSQNGQVYTFGIAQQGQLGITLQKGYVKNVIESEGVKYSRNIQQVEVFENQNQQKQQNQQLIESLTVGPQHVYAMSVSGQVYFWGFNHHGLALDRQVKVLEKPKKIEQMQGYNFQQIVTSRDHTLAVGRSIILEFVLTDLQDETIKMHSVHVYDENNLKSLKDIRDVLNSLKNEQIGFINDFDIPYFNVQGGTSSKYPKLKKKKKARRRNATEGDEDDSEGDDDDDGDDREEEEEDDEEEDKDDDEEDEDEEGGTMKTEDDNDDGESHKKKKAGAGGGQQTEEDDNEDEDGESNTTAANKKKNKKKSKKNHKRKKSKRRRRGGDGSEDDNDDEHDAVKKELTPLQVKERAVRDFVENLNQKKNHFKDIQQKLMPPICELEEEYELTEEDQAASANAIGNINTKDNNKAAAAIADQRRASGAVVKQQQHTKSKESDSDEDDDNNNDRKKSKKTKKRKHTEEESDEDEEQNQDSDDESDNKRKRHKNKRAQKKKRSKKHAKDSGSEEEDDDDKESDNDNDSDDNSDDDSNSDEDDSDEDDDSGSDDDEEEEEESEEEDDYIKQEKSYQVQNEPDEIRLKQLHKHKCRNFFYNHKVLFVNFIAEDCQYVLKKLISLVDLLQNNLRVLIINMPQDATMIDTYYAKLLCQLCFMMGGELQVFFIKYEDKCELINKVFHRDRKKFTQMTQVRFKSSISEGTLVYAWGCANYGKLGLSHKIKNLVNNKQFYQEMKYVWTQSERDANNQNEKYHTHQQHTHQQQQQQEDQEESVQSKQQHLHNSNINNNNDLHNVKKTNLYGLYTCTPQPIISLLGVKIRQIDVGENHCMALSADGSLYVWGDNRKHQLGIQLSQNQRLSTQPEDDEDDEDLQDTPPSSSADNAVTNSNSNSNSINTKMPSNTITNTQMKQLQKHQEYIGVPTMVESINGKVNYISCGSQNSYASVNLV